MTNLSEPKGILLDTCAVIWLATGAAMRKEALNSIFYAGSHEGVLVSPISAWEIGLLDRKRPAAAPHFMPDAKTWFSRLLSGPSVRVAPFTYDIAINASHLPEPLHGDPADRILIATSRHLGFPLVTRDSKIAAYALLGHVDVISC